MFDVDLERNIPTWYSTIPLFIVASLLLLIAIGKRAEDDRWKHA